MVEQIADMVIINTSETYWDIIYHRICDIKLPVFYKNGEKATKKKWESMENPFAKLSLEKLYLLIKEADVVSFDFLIHCL